MLNKIIKKKKLLIFIVALLFVLTFDSSIKAENLSVTDNGAGSTTSVNIDSNQQTTIDQSNEANLTNQVDSQTNTGGNASSGNTGGQNIITTGDAETSVDITNKVNLNQVQIGAPTVTAMPTRQPTFSPAASPTPPQGATPIPSAVSELTATPAPGVGGVSVSVTPSPSGEVAGVSTQILPVSGNGSIINLSMIGIITLLLGIYFKRLENRSHVKLLNH